MPLLNKLEQELFLGQLSTVMWPAFECFYYNLFFISQKSITFAAELNRKCLYADEK